MKQIKNAELQLGDIPQNAREFVAGFASSFDGYEYCGNFQECARISKKVELAIANNDTLELTLSEVRASLFIYYRALRHSGAEQNDQLVTQYLNLIRFRVLSGKIA